MSRVFMDGTDITPGSEKCRCDNDCEFPCWQRIGIADACETCNCPAFPDARPDPDLAGDYGAEWKDGEPPQETT